MTTPITTTADRLLGLAAEATPGPWTQWAGHALVYAGKITSNTTGSLKGAKGEMLTRIADCEDLEDDEVELANAAFIAAARDAVPALCSAVKEMAAERDALRAERSDLSVLVTRLIRRMRAARSGEGMAAGDDALERQAIGYLQRKGLMSPLRGEIDTAAKALEIGNG